MSRNLDTKLTYQLFLQHEYNIPHPAYEMELNFYNLVKEGDIAALHAMESTFVDVDHEKRGKLSDDPVRNLRYHLIVTISMITRFCIEGGLDSGTAYTLSDLYIQKADTINSYDELKNLHKEVTFDFAQRMHNLQKQFIYSKCVILCMDYIYEHLHETITITQIANTLHFNETYLSKLFKKETQVTVNHYITHKKMEAAKKMLLYSEYSCLDIANFLAYTSQSYFIQVFKKQTGMTPLEYRNKFFRKQFLPLYKSH